MWPGQHRKSEVRGGGCSLLTPQGVTEAAPSAELTSDPTSDRPNTQINRRPETQGPHST